MTLSNPARARGGEPRPFCTRCLKAQRACLCAHVRPFSCSAQVVLLMHRKEQRDRSGTGTGRLTHHCLTDSRLFVGLSFENDAAVRALLGNPRAYPLVLYPAAPGEPAFDLASEAACAQLRCATTGASPPREPLVFVLDGSWSGARKLLEANPTLAALPRVSFSTRRVSGFRFKTQPRPECLSTIEAVHELLCALERANLARVEPPGAQASLLSLFEMFVAFQDAFSPRCSGDSPHGSCDAGEPDMALQAGGLIK